MKKKEDGTLLVSVLGEIFSPFDVPAKEASATSATSPTPFKPGDAVAIHKFGWAGQSIVAEVRGDCVRVEAVMTMFGKEEPLWFHFSELRLLPPGEAISESKKERNP